MSEQKQDHPRQDIIEFLCGAGTYDSLWWHDTPKDKRPTYWWRSKLRDHNADLLAKVEETKQLGELLAIMHGDGGHHQQKVGTKQAILDAIELLHKKWVTNEALHDINELCAKVSEQSQRIQELVEALRERIYLIGVQDWTKYEKNFLESLLSKFNDKV